MICAVFGENVDTRWRGSASLRSEFFFDEPMQMIANHRMIEALDYFVKESGYE